MYSLVVSRCATSFIAKVYSTDGCKQNYVLCLLVETEKKKHLLYYVSVPL